MSNYKIYNFFKHKVDLIWIILISATRIILTFILFKQMLDASERYYLESSIFINNLNLLSFFILFNTGLVISVDSIAFDLKVKFLFYTIIFSFISVVLFLAFDIVNKWLYILFALVIPFYNFSFNILNSNQRGVLGQAIQLFLFALLFVTQNIYENSSSCNFVFQYILILYVVPTFLFITTKFRAFNLQSILKIENLIIDRNTLFYLRKIILGIGLSLLPSIIYYLVVSTSSEILIEVIYRSAISSLSLISIIQTSYLLTPKAEKLNSLMVYLLFSFVHLIVLSFYIVYYNLVPGLVFSTDLILAFAYLFFLPLIYMLFTKFIKTKFKTYDTQNS